jgi:hypothetical protein
MSKKIIVRIAEGIGNQLFMYAHAYALSKKINYDLYTDNTSGYFQKKNQIRSYELDKFNINISLSDKKYRFDNFLLNLKRNLLKKIDIYKTNKSFLIESKDRNKITNYYNTAKLNFSDILYVEGYYETEKYFKDFADDLKKKFTINEKYLEKNNKYIDLVKNSNSVSISVRQHRFSERRQKNYSKSIKFIQNTVNYINKAVIFFKNKIPNAKFFIWSNDFTGLNEYFDENEFIFIKNNTNKFINDFNLFKYAKHFIVGPTSFHWWGAWLNQNRNKICVRPPDNLNPSNNKNFWPESWIKID